MDYPKDSDTVETFECNQTQSNRYDMIFLLIRTPFFFSTSLQAPIFLSNLQELNQFFLKLKFLQKSDFKSDSD